MTDFDPDTSPGIPSVTPTAHPHPDAPTFVREPKPYEPVYRQAPGELTRQEQIGRDRLTISQRLVFDEHFDRWGRYGDALNAALQSQPIAGVYPPHNLHPRFAPLASA